MISTYLARYLSLWNKKHNDSSYFPNKATNVLDVLNEYGNVTKNMPDKERLKRYEYLSFAHSDLVSTKFKTVEDGILSVQNNQQILFPKPIPLIKYSHILCGYQEWLLHKYTLPGFLNINQNDVVVDCGSYVGGFSLAAASLASKIYAFEPDEKNYYCCKKNLSIFDNISVYNLGLYNITQKALFNISESSVEHSILQPDDGAIVEQKYINVVRLSDFMESNNISKIDFLKLEAEGVEPEIFEGLGEKYPKKIAIDISPERNGLSPEKIFLEKLSKLSYKVKKRGNVLFAKLQD